MKNLINKIKAYIIKHKILSTIILIAVLFIGYWGYNKITSTAGDTRYITAKVEKGTIIASISGSGQVSSSNQIDLKANVSGPITYVGVKSGDKVVKGKTLFSINNKDAQKSIRDAEISLESAQISFEKLKIQNSNENMNADLAKAYDDGFNTVSNVFLDLPGIMTGLNDMFFKSIAGTGQWNVDWYEGQVGNEDRDQAKIFKQKFVDSYNKAKTAYDTNFNNYKTVSRISDNTTIETLISQTYDTTKLISDAIKNANNYIDFVNSSIEKNNYDTPAIITTHKATLSTDTSKTNGHLTSLLSIKTSIKSYKDAFTNNDFDTQSQQLSLKQKENALQDLKDKLSDYYVSAPFNGTIASVAVKVGDTASGALGSLITNQKIAEISLNEVDVAKIKIGQKSTLTFDAITDLTISGVVAEIDTLGTVSQGVVTYIVKISFDTQDERVKSGMSVSAAIITDIKQDVLVVPNSAVKSQGGTSYVESFNVPLIPPTDGMIGSISTITPNKIGVEIGLSNDSQSEIISGINEGDEIVTRTILPSATKTTAVAPNIFGSPATGNRGGGGGVRVPGN